MDGEAPAPRAVMFGIPTLNHQVSAETFRMLIEAQWLLGQHRIANGFIVQAGQSFVTLARNAIATEFLTDHPYATDLFWIDDDVGTSADHIIELINRPEDIVFGCYPKKMYPIEWPMELECGADGNLVEENGLYRAKGAPMGFMRIKRHVIEAIAKDSNIYEQSLAGGKKIRRFNIFESGRHEVSGQFWGEDYCFCQKAREKGFKIHLVPNIAFTHRGHHTWSGNFADRLAQWKADGAKIIDMTDFRVAAPTSPAKEPAEVDAA